MKKLGEVTDSTSQHVEAKTPRTPGFENALPLSQNTRTAAKPASQVFFNATAGLVCRVASEQWKEKNERNRVITAHPTTRSSHQLSLSTKGGKARSIPFSGSHAGRERRQNEEKDKKTEAGDVKRNKRLIKE